MKFQKGMISGIAVLCIIIASGCGQKSKNTNVASNSPGSPQEVNISSNNSIDKIGSKTILYKKDFTQTKPELSNFVEGISFDLSDQVENFFTQDIADRIHNNMKAIFQHDETKFKENMLDENAIKFNMEWFNYKYEEEVKFEFKEVNEITYDEDAKRIQVVVTFNRSTKDKEIEQRILAYSLLENKDNGLWLIATMDGD